MQTRSKLMDVLNNETQQALYPVFKKAALAQS